MNWFKLTIGVAALIYALSFVYHEYRLTVKHNYDIRWNCVEIVSSYKGSTGDLGTLCRTTFEGKFKLPFRSIDDLFRK